MKEENSTKDPDLSATAWTVLLVLALAIFVGVGCVTNIAFPQTPEQQRAHDWIVNHLDPFK